MISVTSLLSTLRYEIRSYLGRYPICLLLISFFRGISVQSVSSKTDIVLEAYPRSANTYVVAAVKYLSNEKLVIAHHKHSSAQFKMAYAHNCAAVLVLRNPMDSISSLAVRRPNISLSSLIREYVNFHRDFVEVVEAGYSKYRVLSFEGVVNDKNIFKDIFSMMGRSYDKEKLTSSDFSHSVLNLVEDMERVDSGGTVRESHVARPSNGRSVASTQVKALLKSDRYLKLMSDANDIYSRLYDMAAK